MTPLPGSRPDPRGRHGRARALRRQAALGAALALLAAPASADELFWRLLRGPWPWEREALPFHDPVLDEGGRLLPWTSYDRLIRLAMGFVERVPRDLETGLPWYQQYCCFRYQTGQPRRDWPHNPAGLYGMLVETVVRYHAWSGERKWIEFARPPLDHLIAESTPPDAVWPSVPYASAEPTGHYRGASWDGIDGIEPDKVGQAAVGYLRFFQLSGERAYLARALHCAAVLAARVRPGDASHSPWPFRVNALTGQVIEEYTADVLWPIALFDELERIGQLGEAEARARRTAWEWLLEFPMRNMRWKGYFEDVFHDPYDWNRDQYTPGEVARYLMLHPERDPAWREHVPALLAWIEETFGDTRRGWYGATGVREQRFWMHAASSHTARYASLLAMWHARGGGESFREEALRSFALASYLAREDGIVVFSIGDQDVWFSDGYFDYVPHFLDGMAALPEMAPADRDQLLSSSSVVSEIRYQPGRVAYRTFHADGEELLRLTFRPERVLLGGHPLAPLALPLREGGAAGYDFSPELGVLRIRRAQGHDVAIEAPAVATSGSPRRRVGPSPPLRETRLTRFLPAGGA